MNGVWLQLSVQRSVPLISYECLVGYIPPLDPLHSRRADLSPAKKFEVALTCAVRESLFITLGSDLSFEVMRQ